MSEHKYNPGSVALIGNVVLRKEDSGTWRRLEPAPGVDVWETDVSVESFGKVVYEAPSVLDGLEPGAIVTGVDGTVGVALLDDNGLWYGTNVSGVSGPELMEAFGAVKIVRSKG